MTSLGSRNPVAFVLDMGCNGLGIARSLGRVGIPVVGVDFARDAPGLRSKYCIPLVTSDPVREPKRALSVLLNEGKKHRNKGIIFPSSDAYVLLVSRFRKELSQYFRFAIPSQQILESIINKRKQYELAAQIGVPCPRTHYPQDLQDVEEIKHEIDYPIFIKPYCSHVWRQRFPNKGFKVDNATALVTKYKEISKARLEVMLQSIVSGPDRNIVEVYAYLSEQHELLATFVTRKLRQHPNNFGVATCLESIHDERALETALKFLEGIRYVGLGSMELKEDPADGKYKLLELNARLPTHNAQAACAGLNFPLIQYMDLIHRPVARPNEYRDRIVWLDAIPDFLAFYELYQNGNLSPFRWLKSICKADCHSYLAWDDIKPFVSDMASALSLLPMRLLRHKRI